MNKNTDTTCHYIGDVWAHSTPCTCRIPEDIGPLVSIETQLTNIRQNIDDIFSTIDGGIKDVEIEVHLRSIEVAGSAIKLVSLIQNTQWELRRKMAEVKTKYVYRKPGGMYDASIDRRKS